jgi:hypothetical protein
MIKILCRVCLLEHKFSSGVVKNSKISENFKVVTSIIYWSIVNIFRESLEVTREIDDPEKFSDYIPQKALLSKRLLYRPKLLKNAREKKYRKAFIDYEERHTGVVNDEENKVMSKVLKKLPSNIPDTLTHEVEFLSKELHREEDLIQFFQMAEGRGFYVNRMMKEWVVKLRKILPEVSQKDDIEYYEAENK